ncbi:MAG TPA: T9SS type A sorting domain-containing protein [Bacteroidia bacterium]|nr:T9SS type A sorting domain-containing protein [Bacteroidia bacterium]
MSKNLLYQNSNVILIYLYCFLFQYYFVKAQPVNFVGNGSFEELIDCSWPPHLVKVKYWRSIDSVSWSPFICSTCAGLSNAPWNANTFQVARTGNNYGVATFFCDEAFSCTSFNSRIYFRNRLKAPLQSGHTYCVKFYVNIANTSTFASDGFAAYFGNNSIDTITKTGVPLVYLQPQIQNPAFNIISDTLNWIPILGVFVANGDEKHMLIGNFKNDLNTHTLLITSSLPQSVFTDVCLDDVSCIDIDLPAYAGSDTYVVSGGSVYIGRERDVGIDEACVWYKLPNSVTAIDTAAGIWVSPTTTSTYMVVQDICGNIKRDTVVVSLSGVGSNELEAIENDISMFPNPASDYLQFQYTLDVSDLFTRFVIYNSLGQIMREDAIEFKSKKARIHINDLSSGVYSIELKNSSGQLIKRRFVVAR